MSDNRRIAKTNIRYRSPREPGLLRQQLAEKMRLPPQGSGDPAPSLQGGRFACQDANPDQSNALAPVSEAAEKPAQREHDARLRFRSASEPPEFGETSSGTDTLEAAHEETYPLDLDQFPTPSPSNCHGFALPSGPDLVRKQHIVEAIESQRERRGQKAGRPEKSREQASSMRTQADLLARGRLLLERYRWEEKIEIGDADLDLSLFVDWLTVMQLFWSASSWRLYQLAALAVIQTFPNSSRDEAIAALIGSGRIEAKARRQYVQSRAKNPNLSENRAELISEEDYRKLRAHLREMSGSRTVIAVLEDWLVAGLYTGVLPAEWPLADLESGLDDNGRRRVWLHVVNVRATGVHRTLDISGCPGPTLKAIERMVERAEQWALAGTTARHQSEVARALDQACDEFFPGRSIRFSLHTVRHQFMANMKAVLQDDAMVSALIGQIVVKTERAHYAKRRAAWSTVDIREVAKPLERQVTRFRRLLGMYEERLIYREAKAARRIERSSERL